ncbi:MAG: hypothetical protein KDB27_32710 [Planctomycetales bacterium]|nr:hypothetical protein [Planctomycetales bacterium]
MADNSKKTLKKKRVRKYLAKILRQQSLPIETARELVLLRFQECPDQAASVLLSIIAKAAESSADSRFYLFEADSGSVHIACADGDGQTIDASWRSEFKSALSRFMPDSDGGERSRSFSAPRAGETSFCSAACQRVASLLQTRQYGCISVNDLEQELGKVLGLGEVVRVLGCVAQCSSFKVVTIRNTRYVCLRR